MAWESRGTRRPSTTWLTRTTKNGPTMTASIWSSPVKPVSLPVLLSCRPPTWSCARPESRPFSSTASGTGSSTLDHSSRSLSFVSWHTFPVWRWSTASRWGSTGGLPPCPLPLHCSASTRSENFWSGRSHAEVGSNAKHCIKNWFFAIIYYYFKHVFDAFRLSYLCRSSLRLILLFLNFVLDPVIIKAFKILISCLNFVIKIKAKHSRWLFLKMGHSRPLFFYFRLFYKQLTVNKCSLKVADDWIRTQALWCHCATTTSLVGDF